MINMNSKPVLGKELLLSTVQFTSLNSIVFKNVKNVFEGNEKITLEFEHSTKIESSSRDWIGIFPHGWSSLQQYITFEWVSESFSIANADPNKENADLVRRAIIFSPKYHIGSVNTNSFYQFVYISKQIEVLGVSSYFRFDMTSSKNRPLELECLVPASSKLRSMSVSDFGILLGNNLPSSTSIDTRTHQTASIQSLQHLDAEIKNWSKLPIYLNAADVKKNTIYPRRSTGTCDALDPYSSQSEPVFPMSFQMAHCKKCIHFKRGNEFLRSQQVLQSKVGPRSEETPDFGGRRRILTHELSENKLKIVMERNKVLEERSQEMKKEIEKLQAESKKLKMAYYNTNKEKVAYEKFVKDFIKSLEKDSIVRVVNGDTEILVKKVNYVGMEEHPRGKKTSKRERELKAVIGLQEITIRNLINTLHEKATSVKDLNQTVKLAQAFSSARGDTGDYGSDAEETLDEASNPEITSEYEFSLTKPQPPEEAVVEDTDTVLNDIRRATELELKDIGINRSLGRSISRDSQLNMPNLSVEVYRNPNDGIRPKKPRLFDNLEDCWPFSESTPKTIRRKILESSPRPQEEKEVKEPTEKLQSSEEVFNENIEEVSDTLIDLSQSVNQEYQESNEPTKVENDQKSECLEEPSLYEDYFDACEDDQTSVEDWTASDEKDTIAENHPTEDILQENNFLVTAIIPQEMSLTPPASEENNTKIVKEEKVERKEDSTAQKGKKFTCELSIDFTSKRNNETHSEEIESTDLMAKKEPEEVQNQISKQCDSNLFESKVNQEKPTVTFKKGNKCLEINITQVDQKDSEVSKNFLHRNVVVKIAKEPQTTASGASKPSKIEFNLALSGVAEGSKPEVSNPSTKCLEPKSEDEIAEAEATPRTEWNDADEDESLPPETSSWTETPPNESNVTAKNDENSSTEVSCEEPEESPATASAKASEDSLRYEKNLKFFQQKTNERSQEEKDLSKEKPSAILIQNGQTKLALIRYQ